MTIRNIGLSILLVLTTNVFGQNFKTSGKDTKSQIYLDSIKATFKKDEIASCVDSLWLKELTNLDLYDNISNDIKTINLDEQVEYELPTELLKARLKEMDAKSPFNIEYNPALENIIKSFLKNRKRSFERLMAISEYYFPQFEEALAKENVPLEIKYLAVVESALNPKAVSRVGATGLWQFMYHTGKQYDLGIDSYVDERSDPLKASAAAAKYMSNMYKIFGDWELVLASYNSGPGNVSKAIRRSGGQQNFWKIRKHLPRETQGYVPAFLATMYIYEYHKEHGIVPDRAKIKHFATDTILVKQQLSFRQISDLLDVPVAQLQLLNPHYKRDVVPFYKDADHYLRLPSDKIAIFASNEDKIYAYAEDDNAMQKMNPEPIRLLAKKDSVANSKDRIAKVEKDSLEHKPGIKERTKFHVVRRGDNLSEIAENYDVSVADIKKWNHLKNNNAPLGKRLKIHVSEDVEKAVAKKETKASDSIAVSNSAVASNENKSAKEEVKSEYHIVQKGDNLSAIARKYNVSVADLKEWNNLENNNVQLDSKLKVAKPGVEVAQLKADTESSNISNYYTVQKGEYLGTIAKKMGVTVAEIREWNNLESDNVNFGTKLLILKSDIKGSKNDIASRVKKIKESKNTEYLVRKGDSLYTIAKKYPGVTVSDIKKWNGISNDELKPGMKLKING